MSTIPLSIDVYVAPMRPYVSPGPLGPGEVATWAPSSSTLISGPTEGILIDALLTIDHADQIAAWAKGFGKKITGVYITHGHSDHWLGLARLLQHFPEARGYAAPEVAGRAVWEVELDKKTRYWTSRFPGELPETPVVPEVLNSDQILVDGQIVNLIHVGQGDIDGSTIFHVPSADAVVCGDVVYNNVHMMMYEADEAKREAWVASIDSIAALNPKIVVAGHKSVGAADLPENLEASRRYLGDFTAIAKKGGTVEDLVRGMLELHGERDQAHTLWISARAEVSRRR
ncbi:MAG TPA: MBL fold metallo-hydrolase [Candidatus Solibacter sp.]|jgi:glyoxylase-like metal-dependent hydrolase (beta-lactamase superfamily II)|nr:MBL fold metallo-hydrolase [Candidatus Solibacter sp.]